MKAIALLLHINVAQRMLNVTRCCQIEQLLRILSTTCRIYVSIHWVPDRWDAMRPPPVQPRRGAVVDGDLASLLVPWTPDDANVNEIKQLWRIIVLFLMCWVA